MEVTILLVPLEVELLDAAAVSAVGPDHVEPPLQLTGPVFTKKMPPLS